MKLRLTENGVLSLYNVSNQVPVKLQVLYLTQWKMAWFTRLTDSEYLSPVLILFKMSDPFSVGDILLIKKVQLQSLSSLKTDDLYPMADADLSHLVILEYQVIDSKSKFGLLYQRQENYVSETSYWSSLYFVKNLLIKADSMAESFFKEEEKRLNSLRTDCNLLRERGNELYKKQNFSKAILHYDMAKQKDHYDPRVWNNSSQAYFNSFEYENARRDALVALKLDPFCVKAYYRAGKAMERLEDRRAAIDIIEAGLYICGSCDDLHALLRQMKYEAKAEALERKCNGEAVNLGEIFTPKKAKAKDSPARKAKEQENKEVHSKVTNNKHNTQIGPILSFLEGARMLYETGKFQNALEIYGDISSKYNCSDYLTKGELQVLKYLISVCKIKSGQGHTEDNINAFTEMSESDSFPFPPAVHYWLARTCEILSQEEKVIHHATTCGTLLSKTFSSYNLCWPGTKDPIPETSPDELKVWFNEGSWRPSPLARCRYTDCISTQSHPMAKREIYPKDFDFRGYVEVNCEELCSICYHPGCWKALKEQKEPGQPGKRAFKEFLGLRCFTPDCSGKISIIRIFDESCQLRNEIFKDKKEKKNAPATKPKKKKDKKKERNGSSNQNHKSEDKKKFKSPEYEEAEELNASEVVQEDPAPLANSKISDKQQELQQQQQQTINPVSYDDADYKVLKPNEGDEFLVPSTRKSKNKNKKKKSKNVSHLPIIEYLDDKSNHNLYLSRLRDLKLLRESQEFEQPISSEGTASFRYLPEYALDPEKPFYLPRHLQLNHDLLERMLQSKMVTVSSSDIDSESINTLLEFMYDWLKEHNPMLITDSRLSECISESFPPNAVSYVNKCGGIKSFLLQSFKFAVIDDVICVKDQVISAQEQVIKATIEKFRSAKYLLSDGYRAQKLSHLLDDSKSTSSSNSSFSANLLASNSITNSNSSSEVNKIPKSYNEVAMSKITPKKETEAPSKLYVLGKMKAKQPQEPPKKPKDSTRKRKLKTMDIDAIEVLGAGEMSQLFNPIKSSKHDVTSSFMEKLSKLGLDHLPSSINQDVGPSPPLPPPNNVADSSALSASLAKMTNKVKSLESELAAKASEVQRMKEEQEALTSQNQELSDRFSQIKMKSAVEITSLKKQVDEAQEQTKTAESNLEWLKSQREGDIRKWASDKARLQEDLKAYMSKNDGLQISIDQFNSTKNQMEEDLQQKSIQLAHQQEQVLALQESLKSTTERARDAEFKYLSMKKELIKSNLEKTKKRLTAEVNKMYELHQEASEKSQPTKELILISINEWEETILKIQNATQALYDDGQRFIEYLRTGRALSALPPGDLQVPSVPDLTVAHLLFVAKDTSPPMPKFSLEKPPGQLNMALPPLSYLNSSSAPKNSAIFSNSFTNFTPSPNISTKIGGHPAGVSFSPGQLPIGANPLASELKCLNLPNGNGSNLSSKCISGLVGDASINKSTSSSPAPTAGVDLHSFTSGRHGNETSELFVSHLPWSFNEEQLKALFSEYGEVVKATILSVDKSKNKGYASKDQSYREGSVVFRTKRQRDRALRAAPLMSPNHALSLHAKETKVSTKLPPPDPSPMSDLSCSTPVTPVVSLAPPPPPTPPLKQPAAGGAFSSSAYGLQGLVDASNRVPRTVSTPTTPTANKPKFQNLRSATGNVGAIGTLPPKLVRPIPRSAASINISGNAQSAPKPDDSLNNSASYKRLIDECKLKFGSEFSVTEIHKAIREVREHNKNSLSGLVLDTIMEQIQVQLRANHNPRAGGAPAKPSIAPWAQLTQGADALSDWGGSLRSLDVSDDQCTICLELLGAMPAMPLPCQHTFHVACIKNWLNKKSDCPICRKFALNSDEFPSLSHNK